MNPLKSYTLTAPILFTLATATIAVLYARWWKAIGRFRFDGCREEERDNG